MTELLHNFFLLDIGFCYVCNIMSSRHTCWGGLVHVLVYYNKEICQIISTTTKFQSYRYWSKYTHNEPENKRQMHRTSVLQASLPYNELHQLKVKHCEDLLS